MERFIKEYANYKKKDIQTNNIMLAEIKEKALKNISRAVELRKKGYITVEEAMQIITNCFD